MIELNHCYFDKQLSFVPVLFWSTYQVNLFLMVKSLGFKLQEMLSSSVVKQGCIIHVIGLGSMEFGFVSFPILYENFFYNEGCCRNASSRAEPILGSVTRFGRVSDTRYSVVTSLPIPSIKKKFLEQHFIHLSRHL